MRIIIALCCLVGCVVQTGYGDGRLVEIDTNGFTDVEVGLIRRAIHGWDEMGVQMRMVDEITTQPAATITLDSTSAVLGNGIEGTTWPGIDRISIYVNEIWDTSDYFEPHHDLAFMTVIAHELGHAMGMNHVNQNLARMNEAISSRNFVLTSGVGSDKEEFCGLYPFNKGCMGRTDEQ
jgi:Matrixin